MDGIKTLRPATGQNASQIDHRIGPVTDGGQRRRIAHIGLHRHDLAGCPQGLHMPRKVRPAAGHADAVAALGQRPHNVAANKAGAADKGHNLLRNFPKSRSQVRLFHGFGPLLAPVGAIAKSLALTIYRGSR